MSLVARKYSRVQQVLTEGIISGIPLTTPQIQKMVYGSEFDKDSLLQRRLIYTSIVKGRKQALERINAYFSSGEFNRDYDEVDRCADDLIEEERQTDDYAKFFAKSTRRISDKEIELYSKN